MPQVLTTKNIITCPHGGLGQSIPGDPIWSVDGGFVLVESDSGNISGCSSTLQCKTYVLKSMGLNATRIRGKKVILVTDFNQTNTGLPLVMSEVVPVKVKDNSSPVPLVDGQPPPPLSPAMADPVPPVVTCVPPLAPFSLSTPTAAPQTVTFTLTSAHPLKWILTLINEPGPAPGNVDLTTTTPPGVIITPLGGIWNTSPLDITMTLELAFLQTLLPGAHRFYMTGINQRGLSGTFVLLLTVAP
jgi:hypothetical protein